MIAPARASNAPRDARRAARLAIQAAAAAAEAAWTPACMDADEFALWRQGNRSTDAEVSRGLRPCHDCPLGYAAEMRAINQCNGTPGGVEEDDTMASDDPATEAITTTITRRLPVLGELPCTGCTHAVVCGLKAGLEAIQSIEVRIPKLPSVQAVQLAATLTCEYRDVAKVAKAPRAITKARVRLTDEQVAAARDRIAAGETVAAIARALDVAESNLRGRLAKAS